MGNMQAADLFRSNVGGTIGTANSGQDYAITGQEIADGVVALAVDGVYATIASLGTAAFLASTAFATAAQGALADSALQDASAFATAAQGVLADSAVQPAALTPYALSADVYTQTETDAAIAALVDTAPGTLDTLNELAAALGDDPNFATTVSNQIGLKLDTSAYTAADVLAKLLTVDGASSGLDADLLDGQHGAYYLAWSNITGAPDFASLYAASSHSHAIGDITGLQTALDNAGQVPIDSPNFTGNPTAPTQAANDNSTKLATTGYVDTALGSLPGGGATNLSGLSDVTVTSPSEGDILRRNGTEFVNTTLQESDIPSLPTSKLTSGTLDDARVAESNVTQHESALTVAESQVTGLTAALAAKLDAAGYTAADVLAKLLTVDGSGTGLDADTVDGIQAAAIALLDSPNFSGTPTVPTPSSGDNSTKAASTAYVDAAVSALIDGAPGLLNTINEIAAAIGDDANFATTMTNALALKLDTSTYTAADILAKLLTVDGAGSGLDADLFDGLESAAFAMLASPALTGTPTAPTAAAATNTTQLATTAFVVTEIMSYLQGKVARTASFTFVANGKREPIDTATTGALTGTLPASPALGTEVSFIDLVDNFGTATFTVGRNGEKIEGLEEDMTVTTNGQFATIRFIGGTVGWKVRPI